MYSHRLRTIARRAKGATSYERMRITSTLQNHGFSVQLLGRQNYVLIKLQELSSQDLIKIRETFMKNRHARFLKSFSHHLPFGKRDAYDKEILAADSNKLANSIKICGFLMQTKVYLFWEEYPKKGL